MSCGGDHKQESIQRGHAGGLEEMGGFSRFGSASGAIWSFVQRGFRVSEALREQFGVLPSEVFAFWKRFGSDFGALPNEVFAFQ